MYHFIPFSLRAAFSWGDRHLLIRALRQRLDQNFSPQACDFDNLGLHDIPDSYRRRNGGWIHVGMPAAYVEGMDDRRRRYVRQFGASCPEPTLEPPVMELLLAPSGLGTIRLTQELEWRISDDLRFLHASQTPFIHSYFKRGMRDRRLPDDILALLSPIRQALLTLPGVAWDPRHQLTTRLALPQAVDFFVGLVVCAAPPGVHVSRATMDSLLVAPEIEGITGQRIVDKPSSTLSCDAVLVVGWDESLLAFARSPSSARDSHERNAVQLFTLGVMHWTGLYDADQLLYDSIPFLFARGRAYTKLRLIRGVQSHLAQLQHEAKVSYLAEHEDDKQILSKIFTAWETDNLTNNLEKKSLMLMGIVDRLNDERLREVGVVFTVLSLVAIVSNLGQHRSWDLTGWVWSGVALSVAVVVWILYQIFSRR